jgi:hypothetical protein
MTWVESLYIFRTFEMEHRKIYSKLQNWAVWVSMIQISTKEYKDLPAALKAFTNDLGVMNDL